MPVPPPTDRSAGAAVYFSRDYPQARQRFLAAADRRKGRLERIPLETAGPDGCALGVDIAWLGPARPRRVLLHSSGLHGVEGFAGSAIQLGLLDHLPLLPDDTALVLVHILNPYGMAWLRRVDEANVDLNRNFPGPGQDWRGTSQGYRRLNAFLNPASPPARDGYWLRALTLLLRHGLGPLRQAVVEGQHDLPRGLFFGGREMRPLPWRYLDWLQRHLDGVEQLRVIDVHTGLGPWARERLFPVTGLPPSWLGTRPARPAPYHNRGDLGCALPALWPDARVEALIQEFGTYPGIRVLQALREENRWHHYGAGTAQHPSKSRLREAFCPASRHWRRQVLEQGMSLAFQALNVTV